MYNLKSMPFIYWGDKTILSFLQRKIIVNSILYYILDSPVIDDRQFDSLVKEYIDKTKECSKLSLVDSQYYYCFNDFDGSTGFDLYDRLNEKDKKYLRNMAEHILICRKFNV